MAENKTRPTGLSVADFLESRASAAQLADCRALVKLFREVTGKPAKMWGPSIVGFGSYHYVYDSGREGDAPLLGFSIRGRELVLYVLPCDGGGKPLLKKLGKHRSNTSCVYVKSLADVDPAVLKSLAVASVKATRAKYP